MGMNVFLGELGECGIIVLFKATKIDIVLYYTMTY